MRSALKYGGGEDAEALAGAVAGEMGATLIEKTLSGNEVYYTAFSSLVILKNSRGEFHCQKGFNSTLFHIRLSREYGLGGCGGAGRRRGRRNGCVPPRLQDVQPRSECLHASIICASSLMSTVFFSENGAASSIHGVISAINAPIVLFPR